MKRSMRIFGFRQLAMCVALVAFSLTASAKGRGNISVQVKDRDSNPVDYAVVELRDVVTGKVVKKCLTNENGELKLKRVKPGNYIVAINTPGFNSAETSVLSVAGEKENNQISRLVVLEGNLLDDLNITETPKAVRDSVLQTN